MSGLKEIMYTIHNAADERAEGYENSGNWQDIRDGAAQIIRAMERNAALTGDNLAPNSDIEELIDSTEV